MITGGAEKTEVYNPSDGEERPKGNLEPFFPGGLKTGIPSPRGVPSVSELATLGGVSVEAVQEELDRWKKCGRLKEDGEKIIILEGTRYPGDDQEPPEESDVGQPEPLSLDALEAWVASFPGMTARLKARAKREKVPYKTILRREYESAGEGTPGQERGQGSLLFPPEEPPAPATPPKENPFLKEEGHSSHRGEDRSGPPLGWLQFQSEEVRNWHAETLKRLNIIGIPNHEEAALYRTWEEFKGNSR